MPGIVAARRPRPAGCCDRRLRARGALVGLDDLEVLADQDLELLVVARRDVRLVRGVRGVVGLGALDRGARVLGLDGCLDLVLGVAGQRGLTGAAAAARTSGTAMPAA